MGYVSFNLAFLKKSYSDLFNPRKFKEVLYTSLHEITHVLGFSGSMIQYWWNTVTKARYSNNTQGILETVIYRNLSTNILKTPKVAQTARDHFNCSLAKGM